MTVPLIEDGPVVATHQEHKLAVGIVSRQGLKRIPRIRWLRQVHLIVAGKDALHVFECQTGHLHTEVVVA